ncbi:hypothetical protein E3N88_43855 [Mikania micrantha]|uniref:Uncharacterized protein n=1 Tax=Mikania micrantha TaxID=192012 RepID=A0A5N6LDW5_9ASTR|nr:hypothetical protein E3N88_43855 [Mikania micrantha]
MAFGKQQHNTQGESETYISDTHAPDYVDLEDEVQQSVPTSAATSGNGASGKDEGLRLRRRLVCGRLLLEILSESFLCLARFLSLRRRGRRSRSESEEEEEDDDDDDESEDEDDAMDEGRTAAVLEPNPQLK